MSHQLVDSGVAVLDFARSNTLSFLADVPEDKWCHQAIAGANHALWVVGHLAVVDDYFISSFGGQDSRLPEAWGELFGMGSTPSSDASAYPRPAEIRDALGSRRADLIAWFESLSDDKLVAPLSGDWEKFAPNTVGLAFSIAWHEGLHAGQLTVVRKSLGLAPKLG